MLKKKRGLGALGVDVLMSAIQAEASVGTTEKSLQQLPVEMIHQSPYQPRQTIAPEALQTLADSIRQQGIVQPIVVRRIADEYQLIAGERRWRAAQQAGLQEIPAVIKDVSDQEAAAIALIENVQREDLNALEEAQAFTSLIEKFHLTHQEIGKVVGRSRAAVSNSLRLLALAEPVKEMLHQGQIEMGHARALLALDKTDQINYARVIVRRQLSVRAAEGLIKRTPGKNVKQAGATSHADPDVLRLEQRLSDRLGASVSIRHSRDSSGHVRIRYTSLDELEGIVSRLAPRT